MNQVQLSFQCFSCVQLQSESGNFQCEKTSSPLNPLNPLLTSRRAGPGQSAAPAVHPAATSQEEKSQGASEGSKCQLAWKRSVALTWMASFPAVCFMSFRDWQWSRRCSPQAMSTWRPGGDARSAGSTETKTETLRFLSWFLKSEEVVKCGNAVWRWIQDHPTLNVKPNL